MTRKLLFVLLITLLSLLACHPYQRQDDSEETTVDSITAGQDTLMSELDSTNRNADSVGGAPAIKSPELVEEKTDLWNPSLFDSIPRYTAERAFKMDAYKDIIKRYESDDFVYSENIKDRVSALQRILSRISDWLGSIMPDNPYKFRDEFGYLFAFLALIALAFILYKVLYNKNQYFIKHGQEKDELDTLAYVERNLMNSNLEPYIKDAIDQENYALGIRYLQLSNIQKLAYSGHIRWKQSKTNTEFANEIQDNALRQGFLDCTKIFDHVWFGKFALNASDFSRYKEIFDQYQHQIK